MSTYRQNTDDLIEILLVEDNPGDIRLIREALEAVESETILHPTTNGDDAIEFLTEHATDESLSLPDLTLVDLGLPGKDGCELLEAIRDNPQLRPLPVIILTSSHADEDIERCYNAHANAYLTKPRELDEYISLMEAVVEFWFNRVQLPSISR